MGECGGLPVEVLLIIDFDGVVRIKSYHIAVLYIDAGHAVNRCWQDAGVVEANLVGTRLDDMVPIDLSLAYAEMPFANGSRAIAGILEHAGQGKLVFADDKRGIAWKYVGIASPGVDARKQSVAAGS